MHWGKFSLRMPGGYDATSYDVMQPEGTRNFSALFGRLGKTCGKGPRSCDWLRIMLIGIGIQFEVTASFAPCTCFVTSNFVPMRSINYNWSNNGLIFDRLFVRSYIAVHLIICLVLKRGETTRPETSQCEHVIRYNF